MGPVLTASCGYWCASLLPSCHVRRCGCAEARPETIRAGTRRQSRAAASSTRGEATRKANSARLSRGAAQSPPCPSRSRRSRALTSSRLHVARGTLSLSPRRVRCTRGGSTTRGSSAMGGAKACTCQSASPRCARTGSRTWPQAGRRAPQARTPGRCWARPAACAAGRGGPAAVAEVGRADAGEREICAGPSAGPRQSPRTESCLCGAWGAGAS
jgi:hypothetical protein